MTTGLSTPRWRTSSYSGTQENCVELASTGAAVLIRDSKHRTGGAMDVPHESFRAFRAGIVAAER